MGREAATGAEDKEQHGGLGSAQARRWRRLRTSLSFQVNGPVFSSRTEPSGASAGDAPVVAAHLSIRSCWMTPSPLLRFSHKHTHLGLGPSIRHLVCADYKEHPKAHVGRRAHAAAAGGHRECKKPSPIPE